MNPRDLKFGTVVHEVLQMCRKFEYQLEKASDFRACPILGELLYRAILVTGCSCKNFSKDAYEVIQS